MEKERLEEELAKRVEIRHGVEVNRGVKVKKYEPPFEIPYKDMFKFKPEKETSIFGPLYGTD